MRRVSFTTLVTLTSNFSLFFLTFCRTWVYKYDGRRMVQHTFEYLRLSFIERKLDGWNVQLYACIIEDNSDISKTLILIELLFNRRVAILPHQVLYWPRSSRHLCLFDFPFIYQFYSLMTTLVKSTCWNPADLFIFKSFHQRLIFFFDKVCYLKEKCSFCSYLFCCTVKCYLKW